jgi:hypothetical protein
MLLSTILKRMASSRLKFYTNIKLQDTAPRIEDCTNIHEGSNNPKTAKATREASTLQDLNCELKNLLTLVGSFSCILGSLTPLTLKVSRRGFDKIFFAT